MIANFTLKERERDSCSKNKTSQCNGIKKRCWFYFQVQFEDLGKT